jgi:hypothetical protein
MAAPTALKSGTEAQRAAPLLALQTFRRCRFAGAVSPVPFPQKILPVPFPQKIMVISILRDTLEQ